MGVSKNSGTPKSSIKKYGFPLFSPSILGAKSPYFWRNTQMVRRYFESDFVNPEVKNEFRFWAQETKHDFLKAKNRAIFW